MTKKYVEISFSHTHTRVYNYIIIKKNPRLRFLTLKNILNAYITRILYIYIYQILANLTKV